MRELSILIFSQLDFCFCYLLSNAYQSISCYVYSFYYKRLLFYLRIDNLIEIMYIFFITPF